MSRKPWNEHTDEEIRQTLKDNHIWLNAFSCINPTDEFKQRVGEQVLSMFYGSEMGDGLGISPTVLIRVNKS